MIPVLLFSFFLSFLSFFLLQGYLSWWNDNISYVLRGCILMELSFRGRIELSKEMKRRPITERNVDVLDKSVISPYTFHFHFSFFSSFTY